MGAVGSFLFALRAAERPSHLKCKLQSNPARGEEKEREGGTKKRCKEDQQRKDDTP